MRWHATSSGEVALQGSGAVAPPGHEMLGASGGVQILASEPCFGFVFKHYKKARYPTTTKQKLVVHSFEVWTPTPKIGTQSPSKNSVSHSQKSTTSAPMELTHSSRRVSSERLRLTVRFVTDERDQKTQQKTVLNRSPFAWTSLRRSL
jgi:hypothetical protein